jgi:hypothetical protein
MSTSPECSLRETLSAQRPTKRAVKGKSLREGGSCCEIDATLDGALRPLP